MSDVNGFNPMKDVNGYDITPHRAKYQQENTCNTCGWPVSHELHNEEAIQANLKVPAGERETAQWLYVNSGLDEIKATLKPYPVYRYGSLVPWNQLPADAKRDLGLLFQRIRSMVD